MANETKIINKPKVTVDGDVSIDDSTPISTNATIQGTPNVAVAGNVAIDDSTPIDTAVTGTVTTNSTIQNATLAVTKSGTWAVDSVGGTVTTNATIQNATLATKGKTSYSDSTTDVNYWLGLYNDNQLIKKAVTITAGYIDTVNTLQSTSVDDTNCALRVLEFLDGSGNVTGTNSSVVGWTQTEEDLALPGITDIDIDTTSIVIGASENTLIGTLSATGATGAITWTIETNAGSLANIRIDGARLEVGSGGITSSIASYDLVIKGVDSLGKNRNETFTITVVSSFSSSSGYTVPASQESAYEAGSLQSVNSLPFLHGTTITFWMKLNKTSYTYNSSTGATYGNIIQLDNGWSNYYAFGMASSGYGGTSGDMKINGRLSAIHQCTYTLPTLDTSTWQHITLVNETAGSPANDGTQLRLYVNGSLISINNTFTQSGTWHSNDYSEYFEIGSQRYPTAATIDEVCVWTKAFSTSEINEAYNSGGLFNYNDHSASSDLWGFYRLGEGSDAVDESGSDTTDNRIYDLSDASGGVNYLIPNNKTGADASSSKAGYLDTANHK